MIFRKESPIIGVVDPKGYYFGSNTEVVDIGGTIQWDYSLVDQVSDAKNFLLAGCGSPKSIELFADFICASFWHPHYEKPTLFVMDMQNEAMQKILSHFEYLSKLSAFKAFVDVRIIGGDLGRLPFKNDYIDYIRMDYTQNFIPLRDQRKVFRELQRVLSPKGRFSNAVECFDLDAYARLHKEYPGIQKPPIQKGFLIDRRMCSNLLVLTNEKLQQVYGHSKLHAKWGPILPKSSYSYFESRHIILTK